jgi:hypothetical protein
VIAPSPSERDLDASGLFHKKKKKKKKKFSRFNKMKILKCSVPELAILSTYKSDHVFILIQGKAALT